MFYQKMLKYPAKLSNCYSSCSIVPIWLSQQIQFRKYHNHTKRTQNLETFQSEVSRRQAQAKNSILVEAQGDAKSVNALSAYCTSLGDVRNIFRSDVGEKTYFLVEFNRTQIANEIIRTAFHPGNHFIDGKARVKGRFLSFTPTDESIGKKSRINIKQDSKQMDREGILRAMRMEKTRNGQIQKLYNINRLSDLSTRLRFLTALQVEEALSGIFSNARVLPFGSSINGFGRIKSDLDMILLSSGNRTKRGMFSVIPLGKEDDATRYITRNNLHVLSTIVRGWLQGATEVQPVLNARVPIIKYNHRLTNLECDLSMSNFSGYQMSEILYTFGEIDVRVRPLVFYIRAWAKEFDIIQSYPSFGVSNFMLTCLVIAFLQTIQKPILPPSDDFISMHEVDDAIHVTDVSKLNFKTENTSTLAELVLEFFDFYSSFNFNKDALSISVGRIKANISSDSMFVYNPLDISLNVTRNVSDLERNQFVEKCKISRDVLANDSIDAVGLLEFYRQNISRDKIDSFVKSMITPKGGENKSSEKFNVKSIMKTQ